MSGNDGMGGLAALIMAAMGLMLVGGTALGVAMARLASRRADPGRRRWIILGGAVLGLGAGALLLIATFMEDVWAPPPAIRFDLPPGYAHTNVILLEDRSAARTLEWRGVEVPFFGKSATIEVPPGGVVRFRTLAGLAGRGDATATWSDGKATRGGGGGPAPPSLGASLYVYFEREGAPLTGGFPFFDAKQNAAHIRAREARH